MDIDWPVELLRLEAMKLRNYLDYRDAVDGGPDRAVDRRRAIGRAPAILSAHRDALLAHLNRPVCCVACNGTGHGATWGYCLMCDGHRVTDRGLRATLQSVKAMNLAIAAGLHLTVEALRRQLEARHESQDRRLDLDGRWDA